MIKKERFLDKFSTSIFADRLEKEAKRLGKKNIGELGSFASIGNIYLYTKEKPKMMRSDTLFKLGKAGVDLNYLFTGIEPSATLTNIIAEPKVEYAVKDQSQILLEHLQKEVEEIKATLNKLGCQQNNKV